MSKHYIRHYTKEDITSVLLRIHECISLGNYVIARNKRRDENVAFIQAYGLTAKKQRKILMTIKVEDFCHSLNNTKPGYEHEILYVFCPQVTLHNLDDEEQNVELYTKFNIIDSAIGERVVVILRLLFLPILGLIG